MKLKSAFIFLLPILCMMGLTTIVLAQQEVPTPYNELKNPFPWSDTSIQTAGKSLFQQHCFICHGGGGIEETGIKFITTDYPAKLESSPDYYFWEISEGIEATDMLPFKFILSETERWQVMTYMWSLGSPPVVEPVTPAAPVPSPVIEPVTPAAPVPPPVIEPVTPAAPVPPPVIEPVTPAAPVPPPVVEPVTPAAPVLPPVVEPVTPVTPAAPVPPPVPINPLSQDIDGKISTTLGIIVAIIVIGIVVWLVLRHRTS